MGLDIPTFVARTALVVGAILFITLLVNWLLNRFIPPLMARQSPLWTDILTKRRVLHFIALTVPGLLVAGAVQIAPTLNPTIAKVLYKSAFIYSIIMLSLAAASALFAYNDYYDQHYDFARDVPIKTVIQIGVASVFVLGGLFIVAILLEVPLIALAGAVAALTAIAAFMFREPMLGLASSIQLSANHMVALGDWIEMPNYGVDGIVKDINITSVKVENWDNAIVNIPTYSLIQNSFTNWRSMQSKEARQIMRSIYIDQTSIAFLTEEQREALLDQISELYENMPKARQKNRGMQGVTPDDLREREQLTNLELYMAYATQIIAAHSQTRTDYSIYVRQQAPSPQGLPVETYFFTRDTDFIPYHAVQREIFSNLLAVLPQFELRPYQILDTSPS